MKNTICQVCGGIGDAKYVPLFTYCRKCQTYAVHRYCLEKLPGRDEEVLWWCEQCKTNPPTISPGKKRRLCFRRDKEKVESQIPEPNCSDSITRSKDCYKQIPSPAETVSTQKLESSFTHGSIGVVGDSVQNKGEDYEHTPLELSEDKILGRLRLVLADDDNSDSIKRPKDYDEQIPNPAESILTQKLSGPTTSLVLTVNKGSAYECLSSKLSEEKKFKRRRLVVADDDDDEYDSITGLNDCYEHIPRPSKKVLTQKLENGPTSSSVHVVSKDKSDGCSSLEHSEDKKFKRRRLVLTEDDGSDQEFQSNCVDQIVNMATGLPTESSDSLPSFKSVSSSSNKKFPDEDMNRRLQIVAASGCMLVETNDGQANMYESLYQGGRPIIDRVWGGCFSLSDEEYGPFSAHLSNKACEKVCNLSKLLPPVLCMEKLPRLDAWPNSFKTAPPTDENIGLYFFPECARVAAVFDQLLNEVINKDLILKFVLDGVELLVFSATILPEDHQKFQGKHYLWGVFRGSQNPPDPLKSNCSSKSNELAEENQTDSDILEGEICDDRNISQEGVEEAQCLELFPQQAENLGIVCRVGTTDELNLDLGLRPADGRGHCELRFSTKSKLFDGSI